MEGIVEETKKESARSGAWPAGRKEKGAERFIGAQSRAAEGDRQEGRGGQVGQEECPITASSMTEVPGGRASQQAKFDVSSSLSVSAN